MDPKTQRVTCCDLAGLPSSARKIWSVMNKPLLWIILHVCGRHLAMQDMDSTCADFFLLAQITECSNLWHAGSSFNADKCCGFSGEVSSLMFFFVHWGKFSCNGEFAIRLEA